MWQTLCQVFYILHLIQSSQKLYEVPTNIIPILQSERVDNFLREWNLKVEEPGLKPSFCFFSKLEYLEILRSERLFCQITSLIQCIFWLFLSPRPFVSPKFQSYTCYPNRNIFTLGSSRSCIFSSLPYHYFGCWKQYIRRGVCWKMQHSNNN